MAPASPAKKSAGLPWRSDGGRRDSFGDGPAGRGPVLDPPDDDKARDKHVEPKRGVLSDAGSIPAASTFNNNFIILLHERPPKSQDRPNGRVRGILLGKDMQVASSSAITLTSWFTS